MSPRYAAVSSADAGAARQSQLTRGLPRRLSAVALRRHQPIGKAGDRFVRFLETFGLGPGKAISITLHRDL